MAALHWLVSWASPQLPRSSAHPVPRVLDHSSAHSAGKSTAKPTEEHPNVALVPTSKLATRVSQAVIDSGIVIGKPLRLAACHDRKQVARRLIRPKAPRRQDQKPSGSRSSRAGLFCAQPELAHRRLRPGAGCDQRPAFDCHKLD